MIEGCGMYVYIFTLLNNYKRFMSIGQLLEGVASY